MMSRLLCCIFATVALQSAAHAFASGADTPSSSASTATAPECRTSFAGSKAVSATVLDGKRYEITLRSAKRLHRFEMRLDCDRRPAEQTYAEAGFERRGGGWWLRAGSGSQRAQLRVTSTWKGMVGLSFQGNVCRSVVGQAKAGQTTFFAEFCIPESDYRKVSRVFDQVELNIVLLSD